MAAFHSRSLGNGVRVVPTNPIVAGILADTLFSLTGLSAPAALIDTPCALLGQAATLLALIALGTGLAEFGARYGWRICPAISDLKSSCSR